MKMKNAHVLAMILTGLVSLFSFAQMGDSALHQQNQIENLLASIPPCDLLEFSSDGALAQLGSRDQILTASWLNVVSDVITEGIPRPRAKIERAQYHREIDAKNERYFTYWPKNDVFRTHVEQLSQILQQNPDWKVRISDFIREADRRIQTAKSTGLVGECYRISQVTGTLNTEWIQVISLPMNVQKKIDDLFSKHLQPNQLSEREAEFFKSGRLSLEEIAELKAIRVATQIFEQSSPLIDDVGGFKGNWDMNGKIRSVCRTEAQTYYFFLRRLHARGLLKHFRPSETWAYRKRQMALDGHGATLIESRRSGELVVVDSWHEAGGVPAHVTFFSDWIQEKDREDIISLD